MSSVTGLMTVEVFRNLPEPPNGSYYELHEGEVVNLTAPKHLHFFLQVRLRSLLEALVGARAIVAIEVPFRAKPEFEIRRADVAVITTERFESTAADDNLRGAPEMVIEVVSPANTHIALDEKEALCLANGCQEFWIVNPFKRNIRVATGAATHRYHEGDEIPLSIEPGAGLAVSEIFAKLPS